MKTLLILLVLLSIACGKVNFDKTSEQVLCENCLPKANSQLCKNPGQYTKSNPLYPVEKQLIAPTVSKECRNKIEVNNFIPSREVNQKSSFTILSKNGLPLSEPEPAFIEFATYIAPDTLKIFAVDVFGFETEVFASCLMRTWTRVDPTRGQSRPPDQTIRQWSILIPQGTVALHFDYSGVTTPTYLSMHGLCKFELTPPSIDMGIDAGIYRFASF